MNQAFKFLFSFCLLSLLSIPLVASEKATLSEESPFIELGVVAFRNGKTIEIYSDGLRVYKGIHKNFITTCAEVDKNDKDIMAAFDGDKVIWENHAGAATALKKIIASDPAILEPEYPKKLSRASELTYLSAGRCRVVATSGRIMIYFENKVVYNKKYADSSLNLRSKDTENASGQEFQIYELYAEGKLIWDDSHPIQALQE